MLSLQLARLTWWTRHHPLSELEKEPPESTAGTAEVASGEGPTGARGAEDPGQGQEQPGGRLRAYGVEGSDGDRHQVMGPQRPHLGVHWDGVSKGILKISPFLFPDDY